MEFGNSRIKQHNFKCERRVDFTVFTRYCPPDAHRFSKPRFNGPGDGAGTTISVEKSTYRLIPMDSLDALTQKGRNTQHRDFRQ